jgi:hypothetical protein
MTQSNIAPAEDVVLSEQAERVLLAIAENQGFLITQEEADVLMPFVESAAGAVALSEMKSIVKLNRQAKLDSLIVHSALVIAQQKKDPLFKKYAAAASIKRQFRSKIVRKYNTQAQAAARKLLANAGKHNMVDVSSSATINAQHNHNTAVKPVHTMPITTTAAPGLPTVPAPSH